MRVPALLQQVLVLTAAGAGLAGALAPAASAQLAPAPSVQRASAPSTQLAPAPSTLQHVTVVPSAATSTVAPGRSTTLHADVTPKPSIHVYAAGATDFKPVTLVITPNPLASPGRPSYTKPDVATAQGSTGNVPAYAQPFRISVPITISAAAQPGQVVTLAGVVNYQACDDRLCYPPSSAPVVWTLAVKRAGR